MKYLLAILPLLFGCGSRDKDPPHAQPNDELKQQLGAKKGEIFQWAMTRDGVPVFGNNDNGNSNIWSGALCLSGQTEYCRVFLSEDCSLKRSPWSTSTTNEASRDELLGALATWSVTKNKDQMNCWLSSYQRMGKLCSHPTDDRCDLIFGVHTGMWGLMYYVWKHAGMEPTFNMKSSVVGDADATWVLEQAKLANPVGYRLHLQCFNLLVRQKLGEWNERLASAARVCNERQPENPFYLYLRYGATDSIATLALDYMPTEENKVKDAWYLQSAWTEEPWKKTAGWPDIFMANLLLNYKADEAIDKFRE